MPWRSVWKTSERERKVDERIWIQRGIYYLHSKHTHTHTHTVALVFNVFEKHYNQIGVYTKKKLKNYSHLFSKSRKKKQKKFKTCDKNARKKVLFLSFILEIFSINQIHSPLPCLKKILRQWPSLSLSYLLFCSVSSKKDIEKAKKIPSQSSDTELWLCWRHRDKESIIVQYIWTPPGIKSSIAHQN